jgi:hypothetical protein
MSGFAFSYIMILFQRDTSPTGVTVCFLAHCMNIHDSHVATSMIPSIHRSFGSAYQVTHEVYCSIGSTQPGQYEHLTNFTNSDTRLVLVI